MVRGFNEADDIAAVIYYRVAHVTARPAGSGRPDQRCLGPLSALEEPVREIGVRPELGDSDVDGADPGV